MNLRDELARRASIDDRVLAHLQARSGSWVSLPDLVGVSGSYAIHSAAARLRKAGERIEWNKLSRQSAYRWVPKEVHGSRSPEGDGQGAASRVTANRHAPVGSNPTDSLPPTPSQAGLNFQDEVRDAVAR